MRNKRAETCAAAMRTCAQRLALDEFGRGQIMSDQDSSFKAESFQQVLEEYDLKHILAKTYTKGAAIVERVQRTIREQVRAYRVRTGKSTWTDELDSILHVYNTSVHSTTNMSPV